MPLAGGPGLSFATAPLHPLRRAHTTPRPPAKRPRRPRPARPRAADFDAPEAQLHGGPTEAEAKPDVDADADAEADADEGGGWGLMTDSVLEVKWKMEGRGGSCVGCDAEAAKGPGGGRVDARRGVGPPELKSPYSTAGMVQRIYAYVNARKTMAEFLGWFQGDFDNYAQVVEDRKLGLHPREGGGHEHIHCQLMPVPSADAQNGDALIFAKYYFDGDPRKIFRQRLYKVFVGEQSHAVEMRIYRFFKEVEERIEACDYDFSRVNLHDDDLYAWLEGCEIFWRRDDHDYPGVRRGAHFIGYMKGGGCTVFSTEIGAHIRIRDDLVVTEDDLWVNDRGFDQNGHFVYGNRRGIPYKMKRVHPRDPTLAWTLDPSSRPPDPPPG